MSNPYGQQPAYGTIPPSGDRRPGTVTAAAWIAIVFSAITAVIFGFTALALLVARDQVIAEMERVPEFRDAGIDADAAVGVLVAVMVGLLLWTLVAIVLAVLVLRRSSVARILLVISSAATALFCLLSITSGLSVVPLVAALATIVLLFTGGAGDWFKQLPAHPGAGYPAGQYGTPYGVQPGQDAPPAYPSADNPYGQQPQAQPPTYPSADNPYGQQPPAQPPTYPSADNPYGQQPPTQPPAADNPYGQPPAQDGTDHPPRDHPGR